MAGVDPTTVRTDTAIVVGRHVGATPDAVFALLTDPARHVELDGSDMLRGAVEGERLTAVGQVFTMEMYQPHLGDYTTANTVTAYEPGHRIAWGTARPGMAPGGQRWEWAVEAEGDGSRVTQTYDWSRMTDPEVLARVKPPKVSAEQLHGTLDRLAAAVGTAAA